MLQAYQADLLRDLDQEQGLSHEVIDELRRTTGLALRVTKQTAAAIGQLPKTSRDSGPSQYDDRMHGQRKSVATRAPPPRSGAQRRRDTGMKRQDLREVINKKWFCKAIESQRSSIPPPSPSNPPPEIRPLLSFEYLTQGGCRVN